LKYCRPGEPDKVGKLSRINFDIFPDLDAIPLIAANNNRAIKDSSIPNLAALHPENGFGIKRVVCPGQPADYKIVNAKNMFWKSVFKYKADCFI